MENKKITREEWFEKGKELFGEDMTEWKFKCPVCGHIQIVKDFKKYKDKGANPNDAFSMCIGRYSGGRDAFEDNGEGPCNYAAYGLLPLGEVNVDGINYPIFAFAESERVEG